MTQQVEYEHGASVSQPNGNALAQSASATSRASEASAAVPMIQTTNLTRKYGELVALDNLNLTINRGDCFGFIGPNGAGKTTTIKILSTLLRPTWGEARIDGLSVGPVNARQVRYLIGYVPDYFGSYRDMVVKEYLAFFAAAYEINGEKRKQAMDDVLALTDLSYKAEAEVNGLSRGMKQRLSIARVLLHDPKVLLLDEPASGLDPRARIEIRELLKELHRMGKTIIISSHILHELADLCNVVGIIERGKLQFQGTIDQIVKEVRTNMIFHVGVSERHDELPGLLKEVGGVIDIQIDEKQAGHFKISVDEAIIDAPQIAQTLMQAGFRLTHLHEENINLETAFMRLTKGLVN